MNRLPMSASRLMAASRPMMARPSGWQHVDAAPLAAHHRHTQVRTKFIKAGIELYLVEDVAHLGARGDIIRVPVDYARNYLVPFKKACYVPRAQHHAVLPDGWAPSVPQMDEAIETILPAFSVADLGAFAGAPDQAAVDAERGGLDAMAPPVKARIQQQYGFLQTLAKTPIAMLRIPTADESKRFYGSVGPDDIADLLTNRGLSDATGLVFHLRKNAEADAVPMKLTREFGTYAVDVAFAEIDPDQTAASFELRLVSQIQDADPLA
ncbi:hypothetical protein CXG81DRAFT_21384 [Caulochytrium protostelioides]|uniref:Ribosomal protein L9 domain-containing protein n=1 Tax=Caulochytrium protostelioides TaxID=1555241 RepID=A0A4P9X099_9FUNG|nr:hypothetical protein CXG81DRAFT_21384 [Caulochytrium protostelioides]|eukprot:RKO98372.1 hypothetical protein CXG81DRAFT_21384 [Caulochytrium protostelioides]